jgi:hypothetical protein
MDVLDDEQQRLVWPNALEAFEAGVEEVRRRSRR